MMWLSACLSAGEGLGFHIPLHTVTFNPLKSFLSVEHMPV